MPDITSNRVKLITDLPIATAITGFERTALVQQGIAKQTGISDIGIYTKGMDYATWVYGNSTTSTWVNNNSGGITWVYANSSTSTWLNTNSSRFLYKDLPTQTLNGNLNIMGSISAFTAVIETVVNVGTTSSINIKNNYPYTYALNVQQITGSNGIATFKDGDFEVFHIGEASDIFGNYNKTGLVGVKTSTPNKELTVNGEISAVNNITTSNNINVGTIINNLSPYRLNVSDDTGNIISLYESNNSTGVALRSFLTRGNLATQTAISANDLLFTIRPFAYNSNNTFNGLGYGGVASINIFAAEDQTSTRGGSYVTFNTTSLSSVNNPQERLRIDPAGRLGINTTTPLSTLDVNGSANINGSIVVSGNVIRRNSLAPSSWNGGITTYDIFADGGTIGAGTGSTNTVRSFINSAGNGYIANALSVATTLSTDSLNVGGNIATTGSLRLNNNANNQIFFTDAAGTNPSFNMQGDNNFVFYGTTNTGGSRAIWSILQRSSASNYTISVPTTINNDLFVRTSTREHGFTLNNNTFDVVAIQGSGINNDSGQIFLYNGGSTLVALNAVGSSYLNGGNVGINTTSPNTTLDVNGTLNVATSATIGGVGFGNTRSGFQGDATNLSLRTNGLIQFQNNGATVTYGSIGSTSLNLNVPVTTTNVVLPNSTGNIIIKDGGNTNRNVLNIGSDNFVNIFNAGNNTVRVLNQAGTASLVTLSDISGNLTASGDVTAFSDERLKKNVKTIENALDKVNNLRGVEYERIDSGKKQVGVIAQEIEKILPEVVHNGEDYKSVSYGNIVGVLIEAIKELSYEVKTLKEELKSKN